MKQTLLFIFGGFLTLTSCKKDITCECLYENKVIFTKKFIITQLYTGFLVSPTHSIQQAQAENECNGYDTTMIGEIWDCSIIK